MENEKLTPAPLLSLCIPTWNRGGRLSLLIENIKKEIQGLEAWIEVVVADNASTDNTAELVAASPFPVIYGRQESTVGITNNIFFATCTLARGKFVWIVGDDDLIAPGGLKRVLDSLIARPDIEYHYVNFCAIDADYRDKVIQFMGGVPPASAMKIRQCDEPGWKILEKAEQLAFLPGYNPSSLFSSLFCYVANREFYVQARTRLKPSNSLDGSSKLLEDMFPQAMITLPNIVGRPVAYIGEPSVLQGANGWEWNRYLSRISILGIHTLLDWMETIDFDQGALARMRASHARTIATKLPPMLLAPDGNLGLDEELRELIAAYTRIPDFWPTFAVRIKTRIETEFIAQQICRFHRKAGGNENRIGMIGERVFREKLLEISPDIRAGLTWAAFNDASCTGQLLEGGVLSKTHDHHLQDQGIDTLLLAMREEDTGAAIDACAGFLRPGSRIIGAHGITTVGQS